LGGDLGFSFVAAIVTVALAFLVPVTIYILAVLTREHRRNHT